MQFQRPEKRRKEEDRGEEARSGWFSVCFKCKEESRIYSEIVAVEGLKKNTKTTAVTATAMMEAEDQIEDQQLIEKLKLKLRGKWITRRTTINGGENRERNPLYKRIKRIFSKNNRATSLARVWFSSAPSYPLKHALILFN